MSYYVTPPTTPPIPQAPAWWTPFNNGPITPYPQPQDAPALLTPEAVKAGQLGAERFISQYMERWQHTAIGLPEMTEAVVKKILNYFPDTIFPEPDDVPGSEPCSNTKAEEMWYKYLAVMEMPRIFAPTSTPVDASATRASDEGCTLEDLDSAVNAINDSFNAISIAFDEGYDSGNDVNTVNALATSFGAMDFEDEDFMDFDDENSMDVDDYDADSEEDSSFEDKDEENDDIQQASFKFFSRA